MTEDQLKRWKKCVTETIDYLISLHMNIYPIYLETKEIFAYPVDGGDQTFNIYDIPLSTLLTEEDSESFMEYLNKYTNKEEYTLVMRGVSPDTDSESRSLIVPRNACAVQLFGDVTGIMIDNNIYHLTNPYISLILNAVMEILFYEYIHIVGKSDGK